VKIFGVSECSGQRFCFNEAGGKKFIPGILLFFQLKEKKRQENIFPEWSSNTWKVHGAFALTFYFSEVFFYRQMNRRAGRFWSRI